MAEYTEGRCALCGGLIHKPYLKRYADAVTMCQCGRSIDAIGRAYVIAAIRPEQYQEIIDRLNYLESLLEKLVDR